MSASDISFAFFLWIMIIIHCGFQSINIVDEIGDSRQHIVQHISATCNPNSAE
jgi:hypothetical protein